MGLELLSSDIVFQEEAPGIRTLTPAPTAKLLVQGITQKGPVRTPTRATSFDEWYSIFGGYIAAGQLAAQVRQFFLNGGSEVWTSRVVHYTNIADNSTKASVLATVTALTSAGGESAGEVICGNAGPYALEHGLTLVVRGNNDGAGWGPTTVTFQAVAGYAETNEAAGGAGGAEPFALINGDNLIISVDGGAPQTITFDVGEFVAIGAATAEEVAAVINAELIGASATVVGVGTRVRITSDTQGTGSSIDVDVASTSIVAAKFDMSSGVGGTHTGSGDFINAAAAAASEVQIALAAGLVSADVAVSGGAIRLRSTGLGTDSNIKVDSGTANTALGFDLATHTGYSGAATNTLRIDGKYDGTYANGYTAQVAAATSGVAAEFNLTIRDASGIILEVFANLSMVDTDTRYVETIVNADDGGSIYIAVADLDAAQSSQRPANGTYTLAGGNDGLGAIADNDFIGDEAGQTGLRAFDTVDGGTLLASPDRAVVAVHNAMITYAEVTRNYELLAILDPPAGSTAAAIIVHKQSLTESENFAMYWPRVKITNPSTAVFGNGKTITVPISGSIAGMYARSDSSQPAGAFAQPVGYEVGKLYGVVDLETDAVQRKSVRDQVFPQRINPIVFTAGKGIYPDGTRTGKADGNFPSIGERRGVSHVELTLKSGLLFAKNQANTPTLRMRVYKTILSFLRGLTANGAFASSDPAQAFFIDVGAELNRPSVVRSGRMLIRLGMATNAPAEWIVTRVTRDTRALDDEANGRVG